LTDERCAVFGEEEDIIIQNELSRPLSDVISQGFVFVVDQGDHPVLFALALAHFQEPVIKVDILKPEVGELAEANTGLEKGHDDRIVPRIIGCLVKKGFVLLLVEDVWLLLPFSSRLAPLTVIAGLVERILCSSRKLKNLRIAASLRTRETPERFRPAR
jgi:hypothetical protein